MRNRLNPLLFLLATVASPVNADLRDELISPSDTNPSLTARDFVEGFDPLMSIEEALAVESLELEITLHGDLVETHLRASLRNRLPEQTLEGTFALRMPERSLVTGYSLDVNGKQIDGVLVAEPEAKRAYASRVRAAVDPGIANRTQSNVFETSVYPIVAEQTRIITATFVTPLGPHEHYRLPLQLPDALDVSITIEAQGPKAPDAALTGLAEPLRFAPQADGWWRSELDLPGATVGGHLSIVPTTRPRVLTQTHPNGERFARISLPLARATKPPIIDHVRVYWDASYSHEDDAEIDTQSLSYLLQAIEPEQIEVVPFSDVLAQHRRSVYASVDVAVAAIGDLRHNGVAEFENLIEL